MNEENLITYYNKFNEDKRLNSRHGQVEFITCMKYIEECLKDKQDAKIIDIGAGCGRYSIALENKGYDVTAVELVKHNLRVIEKNSKNVHCYQGNATNLSKFKDKEFDIVLLFGPMYHLISKNEKVTALMEAKRVLKDDGIMLVNYCMNDYCVIKHGFMDNFIKESFEENMIDDNFHCLARETDLYSVLRLEEIEELNQLAGLKRIKIVTPDGPANYLRPYLNKMDDETFKLFIKYHLSTCERTDMLGAAAHTLDIVTK